MIGQIVCLVICILCSFPNFSWASPPQPQGLGLKADWQEYRSDHFIIHYHHGIPNKYIREFTRKCEQYYYLIAERLGLRRFDFWSWEKRARIFIYPTRQEYIKERNRPAWSQASAYPEKKFIDTYYFEEGFFDTVLPHELTHIILREFIGLKTKVPLWFEEGSASANEDGCYAKYLLVAKGLVDKGTYISVEELEKAESQGARSPTSFYPLSASIIIFLLEDYYREYFVQLCRQLRDGAGFYEAMEKVYGLKNAEDLNAKFLTFLTSKNYEDIATQESQSIQW